MQWWESLILGIVQGITEFLPISSSGHLVLGEALFRINKGLFDLQAFNILLHFASLIALLIYFYKDWWGIIKSIFHYYGPVPLTATDQSNLRLFKWLIIGTIPAAVVGVFLKDLVEIHFSSPWFVAGAMIITALVFWLAEKYPLIKNRDKFRLSDIIFIGCAQAIALLPGVSRSGSTISAGLLRGVPRPKAARFGFLLATPIIAGGSLLVALQTWNGEIIFPPLEISLIGFFASLIVSLASISLLLKFLERYTLKVFALYLLAIAGLVIAVLLGANLLEIKDQIIAFLVGLFKDWGYPIVFGAAMVEAIPLVGILTPGGTVVHLSGVFAVELELNLVVLIVMSACGAIIGDAISFWIGRKFGEDILLKYGPRVGFKEEYLYVTHRFCHQYGGFVLIMGRFNNIVRPFVPMVVGSSKMTTGKFWFYNVVGGIAWSTFAVLIGYFARQSWEVVSQAVGIGGGIIFTVMIIGAVFLVRYEVKKIREKRKKPKLGV